MRPFVMSIACVIGVLALATETASAQTANRAPYIEGNVGYGFGNFSASDATSCAVRSCAQAVNVHAQFGVPVASNVDAIAYGGFMRNVLNRDLAGLILTAVPGSQGEQQVKAYTYAGGIRVLGSASNSVRPFGQVVAGGMNLSGVVINPAGTDVTSALISSTTFSAASDLSSTKFMVGVGGGVKVVVGPKAVVEFGYMYERPFSTVTTFNVNRVYVGIGTRF